ncbi:oligopeptidase B [Arboricoccus pini]|uniref:Oligopeptidase B n=1 Tax=Arboricoccus pini TaxID=1963835 RepID=A0A212RD03_9PROT|nr:S9 family peptidase [Arboricoccus pini]SNB70126.1 oligopeptidase B [Arboricoccus pini]
MHLPQPPMARREPKTLERFGLTWSDDWAWLRDPGYPKVEDAEILAYLGAENAYVDAVMAPQARLIEQLQAELKARLKEDDSSVPVLDRDFLYHWSYRPGSQYRVWHRQAVDGAAVIILDENELAAGKPFFALRGMAVSPDGRLLAIATDEDGSERFKLSIRDIATGQVLEEGVAHLSGTLAWSEDGEYILYVELNESLRPYRVRAHRLGEEPADDRTIFEEEDPAFFVSLGKTRDRAYFVIRTGTHVTTESHVLPATGRPGSARCVALRREGHQYEIEHAHGFFWIRTNDRHENFRLVRAPADQPDEARWEEVIAGSDRYYFLDLACFADFMVLLGRADGLSALSVRDYQGDQHQIALPEAVGTPALGDNRVFATGTIRLGYTSMVTPSTVYDYDVRARRLVTRKVQEIPSGYDKTAYRTLRLMAPSHDGVLVPITLVHPVDYPTDGTGRLHLYGYGAYGHGMDPAFSPHRLTLLQRGFAFAIAHVRGGDEMGWRWYETGKLAAKENSFKDFIAVAEHLINEGWAAKGEIAIRGGSAGGMLMGAVANMRPDLWKCVIAEVPFVDVVNTMSDPSLPLTPIEWPEWGNPIEDVDALRRMLAYSPYDNIAARDYPAMLVTAGISDPRVTYWEPAKFVARLRATQTGKQPLLFKTIMAGGHFGRSGRYDALAELALHYAFMLRCYGLSGEHA